ncbi:endoglucanase A-like [Mytilus galloprovincialis]|uniref:endoglucanase A-like n=1 Tax=Mytilus galloprovincialis TaxID=29158 RepID=UPI003F7B8AF8
MITFTLLLAIASVANGATQGVKITQTWNGGFHGTFTIVPDHTVNGWRAHFKCDRGLDKFETWNANIVSKLNGNTDFVLTNNAGNAHIQGGQSVDFAFNGFVAGNPPTCTISLEGQTPSGGNGGTVSHTTQSPNNPAVSSGPLNPVTPAPSHQGGAHGAHMKHDYGEALKLSMLFYYAQRSGRISGTFNPVPWRGDSAVNDGDSGHDLSGGWYDAGDHVKFNLPLSQSVHALVYGFERFMDGYDALGKKDEMFDMLKWPLDYFMKCWIPDQQIYYFQVGDGHQDHAYWGPPENMHMWRPALKLDAGHGGSDVAGGTVAALASAAVIWKQKDAGYSTRLLSAAKSLYEFANTHRGVYTQTVPASKDFYGSDNYRDEMCTAAAELYRATKDAKYLNDAKGFYQADVPWSYNWGDKTVMCQLLLFEITKEAKYRQNVEAFVTSWLPGNGVPYTPCGLVFRNEWGANRYAGNGAFIAVAAAVAGIGGDSYLKWAMTQMNYMLGDNNYHMSYEIGFGNNYPRHPHHRGASFGHELKGGLVGGPGQHDDYVDKQDDYVKNEVACDYNAGFHSAAAGLYHFYVNNRLPPSPPSKC